MLNHKHSALSLALAVVLAPTLASAQSTQSTTTPAGTAATNLDTVQVTGIRRGIESAIAVKQDATSVVEAISAEDIGKLPDVSIAESISRLPGLAAQRVAGRAQVISVRGLSPDFATTLLNGREVVSTGDNRGVEFDQYPSELVNGVTVYKTPDAALVGQGLSGTIDMQTARPLSFGERVIAVSGRYQKSSWAAPPTSIRTAIVSVPATSTSSSTTPWASPSVTRTATCRSRRTRSASTSPGPPSTPTKASVAESRQAPTSPTASRRCAVPATTSATA